MAWEFCRQHVSLMYELSSILLGLAAVVAIVGFLISKLDRIPLEEALYLAFITAFTVGFGDVTPKSRGARILTVLLAFIGLLLAGIIVGIAVQALEFTVKSAGS